ncbi:MAG: redoxin family protein, partial [Deltaproteobacteria bacterium]|nr:redoxin family protein [Deltaproteobacteria bacterium]
WCGTCDEQSKTISELHDFLSENNIRSVEVFVQESTTRVQKYFAGKGYRRPDQILLDDGEIAKKLNVYVIPRLILVDENYRVYRDGGNLSNSGLREKLEQMLASHQGAKTPRTPK